MHREYIQFHAQINKHGTEVPLMVSNVAEQNKDKVEFKLEKTVKVVDTHSVVFGKLSR